MKRAILAVIFGSSIIGAHAGDWAKAPAGKSPIEECLDLGGRISVGYMTDFYIHGMLAAEDSVWGDIHYTYEGLAVPVTIGAMYLNGIGPSDTTEVDQLDVYAHAALGLLFGFDTELGYTHHFQPEDGDFHIPYGEISLKLRRSLGFADLVLNTNYLTGDGVNPNDHSAEGWYHEVALEKNIAVTDTIGLLLAGGAGYLDGTLDNPLNGQVGSGWNHYFLKASLPIMLNCRTTLTPYVAYRSELLFNGSTDEAEGDNVHSGVSLTVTF